MPEIHRNKSNKGKRKKGNNQKELFPHFKGWLFYDFTVYTVKFSPQNDPTILHPLFFPDRKKQKFNLDIISESIKPTFCT